MIDFHSHLLPAVDDGAATLDESRNALRAMREQGVHTVVVTPHLSGAATQRPEELAAALGTFDGAFAELTTLVQQEFDGLRLERGVELMVDSPALDLSDLRVRLAGTSFVLVEFPALIIPPHCVQALYELKLHGWRPVVAHPERYRNLDDLELIDEIRAIGCFVQVNSPSLVGRYGQTAQRLAWSLLERGWADFLSSDFHARGRLAIRECRDALMQAGGEVQARLLTEVNPARMLEGEDPEPVPPLLARRSLWKKLLGRLG